MLDNHIFVTLAHAEFVVAAEDSPPILLIYNQFDRLAFDSASVVLPLQALITQMDVHRHVAKWPVDWGQYFTPDSAQHIWVVGDQLLVLTCMRFGYRSEGMRSWWCSSER